MEEVGAIINLPEGRWHIDLLYIVHSQIKVAHINNLD
jgi:(p)ppGpp synthase/HD superfamily hydrolase